MPTLIKTYENEWQLEKPYLLTYALNEDSNNLHILAIWHVPPMKTLIGLDKGGYPINIFLIFPWKHMLWVLIRFSMKTYVVGTH